MKNSISSPQRIGVDLDETLCRTVKKLLEHNKITIGGVLAKEEHITDYYLYKVKGINVGEDNYMELFREIMRIDSEKLTIKPVLGASEKLKNFIEKGYENHIVTARDGTLFSDYTHSWISKHFPNLISQIHFANHFGVYEKGIPKSEICNKNGISIMIEDNLDYALELARGGIKTFLLSKPWNFHKKDKHELLKRVEHWGEIEIG